MKTLKEICKWLGVPVTLPVVLAFAFFYCLTAEATTVVFTNSRSTAWYFKLDNLTNATSTGLIAVPAGGSTVLDLGPVTFSARLIAESYFTGTVTLYPNSVYVVLVDPGSGSGSHLLMPETGVKMDDIILPMAAGFGLVVVPLLIVSVMRAVRRGIRLGGAVPS